MVVLLAIVLLGTSAIAQTTQGRIVGEVTDPSGAMIVGADVTATDQATNEKRTTKTASDGHFVFLAVPNGNYTITVKMQGFSTGVYPNVKVDVGRTAEVSAKLSVGAIGSEVVVEAAGDVLQTQTSAVEGTVTGRTLRSLPLNNRDALDFVLLMPGAQQGGVARQSTFDGLPKGALNITMDGINIMDNTLKSSSGGGMFTLIRPKIDTVEEVTVTTAAAGADAGGDGSVQIKFVTKRGGNDWHGSAFEYYRDQGLNANTFFNNRAALPRVKNHLHQYGLNIGGPLIKNKLFIFANFEDFRYPSGVDRIATILNKDALNGIYDYTDASGVLHQVNVYNLVSTCITAGTCKFSNGTSPQNTPDPLVAAELTKIAQLTSAGGTITQLNTYENQNRFTNTGIARRWFNTVRIDYDINQKLRWNAVGQWNHFDSSPDTLNSYDPAFPGSPFQGGQYGRRYLATTALNWTITNSLNYEFRVGRQSAITAFNPEAPATMYQHGEVAMTWPLSLQNLEYPPGGTNVQSLGSKRNFPVLTFGNSFGWVKGRHTLSFGNNTEIFTGWSYSTAPVYNPGLGIPRLAIGMSSLDPTNAAFAASAFPGAVASNNDAANAANLYGLLTGRVTNVRDAYAVNAATKAYGTGPQVTRDRQNTTAFWVSDSFRALKTLTVNYGLRWELQPAAYNTNGIQTGTKYADIWGVSGVGNLFMPGTLTGSSPQLYLQPQGTYRTSYRNFAPSFGFAWSPDADNKLWNMLFGGPGKTVIRGGYSINYTREGLNHHLSYDQSNPGLTQSGIISAGSSASVSSYVAGTVFANGGATIPLPSMFPKSFTFPQPGTDFTFGGAAFNAVDPNLRIPYVQSWNFGIQREINKDMVLDIKYVGNHGTRLWKGQNLNEINIFESGFLTDFKNAQSNIAICRANAAACIAAQAAAAVPGSQQTSSNFANWGLPGQVALPIFQAAFGALGTNAALSQSSGFANTTFTNATTGNLVLGQAGVMANNLFNSTSTTYICRAVGSNLKGCANNGFTVPGKFAANQFLVNPDLTGAAAYLLRNAGFSNYNGLQVELRRRMSKGLLLNVAYSFSHSLTNKYDDASDSYDSFTTLRNPRLDKGPSPWDLRQTLRSYWIYELPFGPGRRWSFSNKGVSKAFEGWEIEGVFAIQSGRVVKLTSGRGTVNQYDSGVVNNISVSQIQALMGVNQQVGIPGTTCANPATSGSTVFWINPSSVSTTCTAATSVLTSPTTPGVFGNFIYLTGPRWVKPDITIAKKTKITERVGTEFRVEFFNAFNYANFMIGGTASGSAASTASINSTSFGRTSTTFNDFSGNQDPGARMIQLMARITF